MAKILSQEEVDALLNSLSGSPAEKPAAPAHGAPPPSHPAERKKVAIYNFRRPDRFSKDQIRSIHYLHDRFARNFSSSLSAYLRALIEVNLVSVEQLTYAEFILSLPDPTYFSAVSMTPLDGNSVLELNPSIVFPMIDKILGGSGSPNEGPVRAISEIEMRIINGILQLLLHDLSETWKQIIELDMKVVAQETSPQLIQIVAPNEVIILIVFEIKMGAASGMFNFCVPSIVLEPITQKFSQDWYAGRKKISDDEILKVRDILQSSRFSLNAEISGNTVMFRDLLSLEVGDMVAIEKQTAMNPILSVEDKPRFVGSLSSVEEKKAFRVKSLIKRFDNE